MDENKDDQPLSSEELLRRARQGLGDADAAAETPADFSIESYPPPVADSAADIEMSPSYSGDLPGADEPEEPDVTPSWDTPAYDPPAPEPRSDPSSWAPPPPDTGAAPDWTASAPTGPAPTPVTRSGSGLAGKLWIFVVIAVVGFGIYSFLDGSKTVDDIAVGDCMDIPEEDVFSEIDPIDCTEPHDLEVYALVDLSDISLEFSSVALYPGDDAVYEAAYNACWDAFESYVGVPYEDSVLYLDTFTPTLEGWEERGDRIANCVLYEVNADATELIQSRRSLRNANR